MSWDSYIDSLIAFSRDVNGNSHIDKACIMGMDGGNFPALKASFKQSSRGNNNVSPRY